MDWKKKYYNLRDALDELHKKLNEFIKANAGLAKHNDNIVLENQALTAERDLLKKVVKILKEELKSQYSGSPAHCSKFGIKVSQCSKFSCKSEGCANLLMKSIELHLKQVREGE